MQFRQQLDHDIKESFNLSESFGPTHNGLSIHKLTGNSINKGGMILILKHTAMKMFPVKSYGKKEVTYLVYFTHYEEEALVTSFQFRFNTLKDCNAFIKTLKWE